MGKTIYFGIAALALVMLLLASGCFRSVQEKTTADKAGHPVGQAGIASTLVNFDSVGTQVTRFDSAAAALDAHDGEIACFDGVFYLYGTSYDCGYEWGNSNAPFCGFKAYSSGDLVNWTDRGFLFDAQTPVWQTRCNGRTYGCYRAHVVYNQRTHLYVLWINVYDNVMGYRVFTSPSPTGAFREVAEPRLTINTSAPAAGLNNGDHDVFVDDDGTAYLVFTDWRADGAIMIEKLNADYTSGAGACARVTTSRTEAPGMMKRNGIYYILYSDPNCGYCGGTGTSYRTAASPLGPWSEATQISTNSCGGQPAFVSTITLNSETVFLYGSDLWNNGAKNEALANFYWAPLQFAADGSIRPIECQDKVSIAVRPTVVVNAPAADLDNSSGSDGFVSICDLGGKIQRAQSFTAKRTGVLTEVSVCAFQSGYPEAGLTVEIHLADESGKPAKEALYSAVVPASSVGWSPKLVGVRPGIQVRAGERYAIVLKSASVNGRYGLERNDTAPHSGGAATCSRDGGKTYSCEPNRKLMFRTFIRS
jgi:hypothetical protein